MLALNILTNVNVFLTCKRYQLLVYCISLSGLEYNKNLRKKIINKHYNKSGFLGPFVWDGMLIES